MEEITLAIKGKMTEFCDIFYFKYYISIFIPCLFFKTLFIITYTE